jgi:hypothetical protein
MHVDNNGEVFTARQIFPCCVKICDRVSIATQLRTDFKLLDTLAGFYNTKTGISPYVQ